MMTLTEALIRWQNQRVHFREGCCQKSHHFVDELGRWIPKADDDVCSRERAWRDYVRVRDDNPNYPFNQEFKIH